MEKVRISTHGHYVGIDPKHGYYCKQIMTYTESTSYNTPSLF